jgi:septum site-determining protein MinC
VPNLADPITIKGTRYGLLIAIREDADLREALDHLHTRVERDQGFLKGATLSVDFGWRQVESDELAMLEATFQECNLGLTGIISTNLNTRNTAEQRGHKAIIGRLGLSQHQGRQLKRDKVTVVEEAIPETPNELPTTLTVATLQPPQIQPLVQASPVLSEDRDQEDTLYLKRTLRSGQRALYAGHVVVMGDVNAGAEIEADGDVVVIGQLRGRVHAGANGNQKAQIWSLGMQPTMLLIADHVWSAEARSSKSKAIPTCRAVLRDGTIQFETASAR